MQIYGDTHSGNCYKVKLLLSMLAIPHRWIHVNIVAGETRSRDYLSLNPNGKIPLLMLDDGRALAESNAILHYLAQDTNYLPNEPFARAKVLEWQFFEQYSHEPYIAVARYIAKYLGLPETRRQEYESKQLGGHKALAVMEQQLAKTPFLCGSQFTIADISLYGYTHVAHEGGFDLQRYPALRAWLRRIEALPGYIGMES